MTGIVGAGFGAIVGGRVRVFLKSIQAVFARYTVGVQEWRKMCGGGTWRRRLLTPGGARISGAVGG